ncbi:type III secretion protein HrpB4 [Paraburkholderia sp. BR13439]|uniref:type III secretion protein HrpB4 n=1 Tax=Paraburkholderia sp. BR13439 TaxID=3236996 RepID=UPI0034D00E2C
MWQRPDAAQVAQMLTRYQENVDTLVEWADPSWTGEFARMCGPHHRHAPQVIRAASRAVWGGASHRPLIEAFHSAGHGVAVLPSADLMRVTCGRALMLYRSAVRRCVDKPRRLMLRQWASAAVLTWVSSLKGDTPFDMREDLTQRGALALAWDGFCLLRATGAWDDPALLRLMRFAFPRDWVEPAWLAGVASAPGERDHSAMLMTRLSDFFPELSW